MADPAFSLEQTLAAYGPVESRALSRIEGFTAKAMIRNWAAVPHVTHHDLIDVDALEDARAALNAGRPDQRLSPLPFLVKAVAGALFDVPKCNAAFDAAGNAIIIRQYANIGVAVDTPQGLVVAVIRDCQTKSVDTIAAEAAALAAKARGKGLTLAEMSGGSFTVSSLGNLGGTGFTPIVNAPEAAILGISRMTETPTRGPKGEILWRRMLPVSLSYDHRIVNGADAGRFLEALRVRLDELVTSHGT